MDWLLAKGTKDENTKCVAMISANINKNWDWNIQMRDTMMNCIYFCTWNSDRYIVTVTVTWKNNRLDLWPLTLHLPTTSHHTSEGSQSHLSVSFWSPLWGVVLLDVVLVFGSLFHLFLYCMLFSASHTRFWHFKSLQYFQYHSLEEIIISLHFWPFVFKSHILDQDITVLSQPILHLSLRSFWRSISLVNSFISSSHAPTFVWRFQR